MSEHGLHRLGGFPQLEHQGRKRMAGIMEANRRHTGVLAQAHEALEKVRGIERTAIRPAKQEAVLLIGLSHKEFFLRQPRLMLFQDLHDIGGDWDGPSRLRRLGLLKEKLASPGTHGT